VPSPAGRRKRDEVVITDARAIRALAHPARLAVLDALDGRELTATACAELTGLSPSAMSYHLRALERWGIVERAAGTDDARHRPWRLAGRGLTVETSGLESTGVADQMLGDALLDSERRVMRAFGARRDRESKEWIRAAEWQQASVWMTAEEAQQLTDLVQAFLARRRGRRDRRPAGARRVRVSYRLVPIDEPPVAPAPRQRNTSR
jgi:DNA-binding transcriptional ArsR family regulator